MRISGWFAFVSLLIAAPMTFGADLPVRKGEKSFDDFPRIARNQARLQVETTFENFCSAEYAVCEDDGGTGGGYGTGGWTYGACNCSRTCSPPTAGCPLGGACSACKALLGGGCQSCIGPSNCGC